MSNQRPRQCNALGHATRKKMRVNVGEPFKPYQLDKFVNFATFLTQHPQRNKAGLDVATNSKPRK